MAYLTKQSLWDAFYAPHKKADGYDYTGKVIYSKDVTVFREDTDEYAFLPENKWHNVDIVTCAAPNNRDGHLRGADAAEIIGARTRRLLQVCKINGADSVVLGAWGCGAFRNDPVAVSKAMFDVLYAENYRYLFDEVVFAVLDRGEIGRANYEAFYKSCEAASGRR
jgi:uncharacterized protein (TIGR02452 family)